MRTNDGRSSRPTLWVLASLITLLAVYTFLVASDYLVAAYLSPVGNGEARRIEEERTTLEDAAYIESAEADGYRPILHPALFEGGHWKALALKHAIVPLAPQPRTKVYLCNEGYGMVRYVTDRLGFRNSDSIWDRETHDVALVGDSFAQGACVDEPHTLSGLLGRKGLSVLNLATANNRPVHYAALAQVFAPKIRPSYLVTIFFSNDNVRGEENSLAHRFFFEDRAAYFADGAESDSAFQLSPSLLRVYAAASRLVEAELRARGSPAAPLASGGHRFGRDLQEHAALPNIEALARAATRRLLRPDLAYGSKLAIDTAVEECGKVGCRAIFAYVPTSEFWRPDYRSGEYRDQLREYVRARGGHFLDSSPQLERMGLSAYAPKGPHLSPEGYRAVADEIYRLIAEERGPPAVRGRSGPAEPD